MFLLIPEVIVVDGDDPVPPLPPHEWIFPLVTHQDLLDDTLSKLPGLIQQLQQSNDRHTLDRCCPTAAMRVGQLAMAGIGGRLIGTRG